MMSPKLVSAYLKGIDENPADMLKVPAKLESKGNNHFATKH